ncbi:Similar to Cyt-b5: Cytochrome b5 (Drosophila melanogaster) [Cotesia congregata]|uniref:Cytochrome b5 n=1 Tax=Cotesia congregata TaxID=51543 RepID=A0A8J2MJI8_COTCN|nr:Similar to Cyt-b5: Cytochrome b5 (Drosophila melanogaster) [Cotesia congregata]
MSTNYFSREEVAKHNNSESIWIIIKSYVYDVTDYLNEHPGGAELIKECAGKDATSDFNNFGHSSDASNLMKLYKIGKIKVGIAYFIFYVVYNLQFTLSFLP